MADLDTFSALINYTWLTGDSVEVQERKIEAVEQVITRMRALLVPAWRMHHPTMLRAYKKGCLKRQPWGVGWVNQVVNEFDRIVHSRNFNQEEVFEGIIEKLEQIKELAENSPSPSRAYHDVKRQAFDAINNLQVLMGKKSTNAWRYKFIGDVRLRKLVKVYKYLETYLEHDRAYLKRHLTAKYGHKNFAQLQSVTWVFDVLEGVKELLRQAYHSIYQGCFHNGYFYLYHAKDLISHMEPPLQENGRLFEGLNVERLSREDMEDRSKILKFGKKEEYTLGSMLATQIEYHGKWMTLEQARLIRYKNAMDQCQKALKRLGDHYFLMNQHKANKEYCVHHIRIHKLGDFRYLRGPTPEKYWESWEPVPNNPAHLRKLPRPIHEDVPYAKNTTAPLMGTYQNYPRLRRRVAAMQNGMNTLLGMIRSPSSR